MLKSLSLLRILLPLEQKYESMNWLYFVKLLVLKRHQLFNLDSFDSNFANQFRKNSYTMKMLVFL